MLTIHSLIFAFFFRWNSINKIVFSLNIYRSFQQLKIFPLSSESGRGKPLSYASCTRIGIMQNFTTEAKKDVLISPLSGAESLFLGSALGKKGITALTMVEQLEETKKAQFIRNNSGRIKKSASFHTAQGSNVSVDDFMSAIENESDLDSIDSYEIAPNSLSSSRPFRITMETIEDTTTPTKSDNSMLSSFKMSTKKTSSVPKTAPIVEKKAPLPDVAPVPEPVEPPAPPAEEPFSVDAAETVYEKVKSIWTFGKSIPVVSFFAGASEAVAGKALSIIGADLPGVDGAIAGKLSELDTAILTPAVTAILKIAIGAGGKTEELLKPIISILMKPLGFLIKSEAEEATPEAHTETPEVTA